MDISSYVMIMFISNSNRQWGTVVTSVATALTPRVMDHKDTNVAKKVRRFSSIAGDDRSKRDLRYYTVILVMK